LKAVRRVVVRVRPVLGAAALRHAMPGPGAPKSRQSRGSQCEFWQNGRHSMLQAARSSVKKFPRRMESSRSTATSPESCSRPRLPLCSEAVAACRSSFRGLPVPASCRVPFERVWD
ncbi:hypothetical protein PC116_g29520, partial [Phytophthora cactorum]